MVFVIKGMKYDTEKMRKVATVKKWYREDTFLNRAMFYSKSMGEAITEEEAKELLMRYATPIYEKMFGELPEA